MYVYLVVLMLNGLYSVQAPNMVFPDKDTCELVRTTNTKMLRDKSPTPNAKYYAVCVKIPKDIDAQCLTRRNIYDTLQKQEEYTHENNY